MNPLLIPAIAFNTALATGISKVAGISNPKAVAVCSMGSSVGAIALDYLLNPSENNLYASLGIAYTSFILVGKPLAARVTNVNVTHVDQLKILTISAGMGLMAAAAVDMTF